jgi:hypothetical protein
MEERGSATKSAGSHRTVQLKGSPQPPTAFRDLRRYNEPMEARALRRIGDILKDRNIVLKGADAASSRGFTQVPNFLLRSPRLNPGDKLCFAMVLSYAWHNDSCFPGWPRISVSPSAASGDI